MTEQSVAMDARKARAKQHQMKNGFKRAKAMVQKIAAAYALSPVLRLLALQAIEPYVSRGHGKGGYSPRFGRSRSKYTPHQGAQECARRVRQMAVA